MRSRRRMVWWRYLIVPLGWGLRGAAWVGVVVWAVLLASELVLHHLAILVDGLVELVHEHSRRWFCSYRMVCPSCGSFKWKLGKVSWDVSGFGTEVEATCRVCQWRGRVDLKVWRVLKPTVDQGGGTGDELHDA